VARREAEPSSAKAGQIGRSGKAACASARAAPHRTKVAPAELEELGFRLGLREKFSRLEARFTTFFRHGIDLRLRVEESRRAKAGRKEKTKTATDYRRADTVTRASATEATRWVD
jgi:hypothetical protein